MKNHKKICSDKGFSLIEIIIAIAILAIITLPLLNAFVTSSRMNALSRNKLLAIETGKNIMEELKGYNLADIIKLGSPNITSPTIFGNTGFEELDYNPSTHKYVVATTKSLRQSHTGRDYDFYPKAGGKYYFYLKNIEGEGFTTNALITVSKPSITADNIDKITPVSTDKDILIDATLSAGDAATKMINDPLLSSSVKHNVSAGTLRREIHITVTGTDIVTVKTEFNYYVNGSTSPVTGLSDLRTEESDSPKDELRSIYLFLSPWNNSMGDEKIVIDNALNKKFKLYIVKQETENPGNKMVTVEVRDGNINFADKSPVKVFTNVEGTNFRCIYYRNSQPYTTDKIDVNMSLVESKSADEVNSFARLYDIEVKVFNSNVDENGIAGAEPLMTLTGGMSN